MSSPKIECVLLSEHGSRSYTFMISIIAAVGGLLFGFDNGVIAGALPFISPHFNMTNVEEGFAVSNMDIGAIIGAIFAGMLTDRFGRKKILIFTALLYVAGGVFSGFSRTYTDLILARMIGGLAIGISTVASPMFIAEIAPAHARGKLVTINQLTIVIGILLSYFSNWLLVDFGPDNWRWMFIVQVIPAGIFFAALFFIPESPRWLVTKGKENKAREVFARIGGSIHAEREIAEIKKAGEYEEGSLRELFRPGFRKALFIGVVLAFFSHMVGINAVSYYAPKIFMRAGFQSANTAIIASLVVMTTLFIFTIVALVVIDRIGRKPLLLIGCLGMGIAFVITGIAFRSPELSGIWLLGSLMLYDASFAISMGGVIWVYLAEIFPNKVRGRAMAMATMILWITEFIVVQTFPWFVDTIGGNTFFMYAGICFTSFIFVWLMIVETKGKTLEEIERMWKGIKLDTSAAGK
ncbi:MAG: sugar porter family MFS transporter [Candidatus Latescibacterota bacterium]